MYLRGSTLLPALYTCTMRPQAGRGGIRLLGIPNTPLALRRGCLPSGTPILTGGRSDPLIFTHRAHQAHVDLVRQQQHPAGPHVGSRCK